MSTRPQTEFTLFNDNYCRTIWQWRNLPRVREQMRSTEEISWQNHQRWFQSALQDPNRSDFVMLQNERPIGALNFTQVQEPCWEWGCYLGETNVWPGSGLLLEVAALDYALLQNNCQQLYAEVKVQNKGALALHKLFEYQTAEPPNADYLAFTYQRDTWQQQRERVLAKLPKPHQEAAAAIVFTPAHPASPS
ncbi:UDP-4-amino-4,6-dideoxy-N-acetyl-beta-L-altrosamine N-acetyltransferase [Pseudidiomarina planktonica]|uniref:UDP-4-amino-4,6-dideoxy-N-acetyl-beta-L-altrosamine N-acetyltransferase n=1 Tax=Pseudidiomarina planktonica TaxID=1323738 RepID=A0A1Y6EHR5_9GAMM|nr:UDP-4-amino-4,6-dideoxy-N-acetyl-beta-L-altrosamine N-acetyltransferase [Pseudidiomarina planktonica]RUO65872.1 UDP-4-amino-4,6-dideoxy-N-acetyl-beta-L-altrosamine N-acetyltransferase [Pseudidiomarina planktonica]SMQ62147.1 UDP-4-amino-4,6-dideoxy-N-acetyl-beta-L-altrosamine N-acetyltransferase [Pseudidiomarina planktonica]